MLFPFDNKTFLFYILKYSSQSQIELIFTKYSEEQNFLQNFFECIVQLKIELPFEFVSGRVFHIMKIFQRIHINFHQSELPRVALLRFTFYFLEKNLNLCFNSPEFCSLFFDHMFERNLTNILFSHFLSFLSNPGPGPQITDFAFFIGFFQSFDQLPDETVIRILENLVDKPVQLSRISSSCQIFPSFFINKVQPNGFFFTVLKFFAKISILPLEHEDEFRTHFHRLIEVTESCFEQEGLLKSILKFLVLPEENSAPSFPILYPILVPVLFPEVLWGKAPQ